MFNHVMRGFDDRTFYRVFVCFSLLRISYYLTLRIKLNTRAVSLVRIKRDPPPPPVMSLPTRTVLERVPRPGEEYDIPSFLSSLTGLVGTRIPKWFD